MLSPAQLDRYLDDGAVTVDGPWSPVQIDAARRAVDGRLPPTDGHERLGETCSFYDAELIALIGDPFLEHVASQALGAADVVLFQTAITNVFPQIGLRWGFEQHVDIAYSQADWEAKPRRIICSFFVWLCDVTPERAPMMFRPGSHRLLATRRRRGNPAVAGAAFESLPRRAYADPQPLTARAGQVTVCTTAAVHGSSLNVDREPRRALVVTFVARGVTIELPPAQVSERESYRRELARLLPPERRHIAR